MKIIFILLLIINIAYPVGMQFYAIEQNSTNRLPLIHPEKIILLPGYENCLEWGNFHEEQIQYAETAISELTSDQLYSLEESGDTKMYWLYIPPLLNEEAANREINKLRNLGIVSFRVKEEGKWENAISLTMLYDKTDALKQLLEIEKKGIQNARIEKLSVTLKKFIIHNPAHAIKEQAQKLVEQFNGTQLTQRKCERL